MRAWLEVQPIVHAVRDVAFKVTVVPMERSWAARE